MPAKRVARLEALARSGKLRFIYVIGVPRSNTTVVCRMLGRQLDGAVYEPLTPNSAHLSNHFADTVLMAYDAVRAEKPEHLPVLLAVKDASSFLDETTFAFVLQHAAHIVFTMRNPLPQHHSLLAQLRKEFTISQRIGELVKHPSESFFYTFHGLVLGLRYFATGVKEFGYSLPKSIRLTVAGWQLASWRDIKRQFDRALAERGPGALTLLDAGLMRLLPEATQNLLEEIADSLKAGSARSSTFVEIAGHSRMFPESSWANEARHSEAIMPVANDVALRYPQDSFEAKVLRVLNYYYGALYDHDRNRLLPLATRLDAHTAERIGHSGVDRDS